MRGMPFTAVLRWAQALACVIGLAVACAAPLSAQYGYFGQNKIQYRRFDWRVLHGEHVDLYYYPEEEELGRVVALLGIGQCDAAQLFFFRIVIEIDVLAVQHAPVKAAVLDLVLTEVAVLRG